MKNALNSQLRINVSRIPPFFIGILLTLCVTLAASDDSAFTIKPYIQDVSQTEATVIVHTTSPCPTTVRLTIDSKEQTFPPPKSQTRHVIKVTGLKPGRVYPFDIYSGPKKLTRDNHYQIRTAGRLGESFSFAVFGDPRPGENQTNRHHKAIINQIALREPSFSLVLGDMVDNGGNPQEWQKFFEAEEELLRKSAIYPVVGDNDIAGGRDKVETYFPGKSGHYHFAYNGVHFFGLSAWGTLTDQPLTEFGAGSEQLTWLETMLAREDVQKAPFRVVYVHDPVVIGRGHSSETLRRSWHPLFKKYKVDMVFSSWHLYERHRYDGVYYIITGGAGAELIWMKQNPQFPAQVEEKRYHFCHVSVAHGSLTLQAIAEDGTVLDSLRLADRSSYTKLSGGLAGAAKRSAKILHVPPRAAGASTSPLELYLFSYNCAFCKRLTTRILPQLAMEKNMDLKINYYDLSKKGTYGLFLAAGADFGRQNSDIPAIFIGNTVLGGEKEITRGLPTELDAYVADAKGYLKTSIKPFSEQHDTKVMKEKRFSALTLGIVLGAGLLDGINPCAFTTLIFLISYLSLVGRSRRQILITGGVFSLAVFLSYMAIGIFFYTISTKLLGDSNLAFVVNSIILIAVLALAVFSVIDFIRCLKGKQIEIALQLPGFLKASIREKIRHFARNSVAAAGASFVLGVVISGMELTCTGQVYVPIVTMIADPLHRPAAAGYLFLYNAAFIIPLLVVFILAVFGVTSKSLGNVYQRHLATVKCAMILLFLAMAVVTLYNMNLIG